MERSLELSEQLRLVVDDRVEDRDAQVEESGFYSHALAGASADVRQRRPVPRDASQPVGVAATLEALREVGNPTLLGESRDRRGGKADGEVVGRGGNERP